MAMAIERKTPVAAWAVPVEAEMAELGISKRVLAAQVGIDEATLYRWLRKAKLKVRRQREVTDALLVLRKALEVPDKKADRTVDNSSEARRPDPPSGASDKNKEVREAMATLTKATEDVMVILRERLEPDDGDG